MNSHEISPNIIANAITKLNKHKKDEIYDLNTNNFIFGTPKLNTVLSKILKSMLLHGVCNVKFYKSIISPIPKNKRKSKNVSSNYRAISLNTIFSKILDHVLIGQLGESLLTSEMQFAYKAGQSITLCTFLVSESIQYYINNGSHVYTLLMDASKAFDRVRYSKLFSLLKSRNICPLIMRMFLVLYLANTAIVKWNGRLSNKFKISNGVKQGGVASSHLFSIYFDPLITAIRASRSGCHIGGMICNAFAYADDLIILCPTISSLKKIIIICEVYGDAHDLLFNPDKSYLLIFECPTLKVPDGISVYICGDKIKIVQKEIHLGNTLSTVGNMICMDKTINDIKSRTVSIVNNFKNISYKSKVMLFNSQCMALYGSQLWDLTDDNINQLNITWRKSARYLLDLSPRTHSYVLPYLMTTCNIFDIIIERQMLFYLSVHNHKSEMVRNIFRNSLLVNSSYCVRNVNICIDKLNISLEDLFLSTPRNVKAIIRRSYPPMDWRTGMMEELLNARDGTTNLGLSRAEIDVILNDICYEHG